MLKYKNYVGGEIEYDAEGKIFCGVVLGVRVTLVFEGRTTDEIERSFKETVDSYLDMCKKDGVTPDRPYSGKFNVRIPPELHREIAIQATLKKRSLNEWVIETFQKAVQ